MSGGEDLSGLSLYELFREEVESHTTTLEAVLTTFAADSAASAPLAELVRAAHSIKGAARIVNLEAVSGVAQAIESRLAAVQEGRAALTDEATAAVLNGVEVIRHIASQPEASVHEWLSQHGEEVDIALWQLSSLEEGAVTDAVPPPEPGFPTLDELTVAAAAAVVTSAPPPPSPSVDVAGLPMLDLFREEAECQTATLADGLLRVEADARDPKLLEGLMRAAHSLKGAARIVGLDRVVRVAHAMEDCFVAAQEGRLLLTGDHVDVLLRGLDAIRELATASPGEVSRRLRDHSGLLDVLVSEIAAIRDGCDAPSPEVPPPVAQLPPTAAAPALVTTTPAPVAVEPERVAASAESRDLKISAESLSRLMGLAGEAVVATSWLEPFATAMRELKCSQVELGDQLETLRAALSTGQLPAELAAQAREAAARAADCRRQLADRMSQLDTYTLRTTNLSSRLYRQVLSGRMRPFADGVRGFPRLVRDLARACGKRVALEIVGQDTEVDRDILERLEAPLNHLLRNAVDHGVEPPAERLAAGKEETGKVTLQARHHAGMLVVTVADDGRGVDETRLRHKVVERGHAAAEVVARMTTAELMEFMFLPGFSTAAAVTEISGRGVGLDVVHSMVSEVGGQLRADSTPGQGVRFHLQLPITRSVLRTLMVEVSGEPLAFPLESIDHTLLLPRDQIKSVEDRQYFWLDGESVGLVGAHQVLELPPRETEAAVLSVVVISDHATRYGVVVDRLLGERGVVVHPLDERLGKVPDVSAAALMEDGSPVLIVDVKDMICSVDALLSGGRLRKVATAEQVAGPRRKRLLVVDDSITVREVERQLLENAGFLVDTAVDGMDGWNAVRSNDYDLVLSDVDMPRMSGVELISRIKAEPRLAAIPVVIVSYKDREEDRLRGLEAGAAYYLTKSSFHDDTMLEAVVDLIGRAEE